MTRLWSRHGSSEPNLSIRIHCIAFLLLRVVVLFVVSGFLTRRGKRIIREHFPSGGNLRRWLLNASDWLFFWVAVRIICPGLVLRSGRWACAVSKTILPEALDILNHTADSHGFWLLFGWTETAIFFSLVVFFWRHNQGEAVNVYYRKLRRLVSHISRTALRRKPQQTESSQTVQESESESVEEDVLIPPPLTNKVTFQGRGFTRTRRATGRQQRTRGRPRTNKFHTGERRLLKKTNSRNSRISPGPDTTSSSDLELPRSVLE